MLVTLVHLKLDLFFLIKMIRLKAYKYRIYPNKTQEELIQKTFGCTRFVYNRMLDNCINLYKESKKSLSFQDKNDIVNKEYKSEFEWLKEVDKFALTNAMNNLDEAYKRFFREKKGFPKFKSKKDNRKSYKTNTTNGNISIGDGFVKLPKLKKVKAKISRTFDGLIKSATISQNASGNYFVSILVQEDIQPLQKTNAMVGIDLGIKNLAITSDGIVYESNRFMKQYQKKLAKAQRNMSKREKGTKAREYWRRRVARLHQKITNCRLDKLHKITTELVREYDVICIEDLSVENMVKNHKLALMIEDASWSSFCNLLSYKCDWYSKHLVKIDRFFASSQTCSECGYKNAEVKDLSVREWTCPICGTKHDRDINAAKNILTEGVKILCGVEQPTMLGENTLCLTTQESHSL